MDLMQSLIASKLLGGGGGSEPILKTKSIYENGTYSAIEDEADGYSSVTVDVPKNVTSRGLTVNGTFSSAVDNKDGYSNVTVNVQEAPVKTTSLTVTENGTYEPDPISEVSITIPTIPDEVETDVPAGYTLTNFDNLRVEFINKTTGTTGHVDVYPSAIAVQTIPMSFKDRTLIAGPDGDHYITIVNGGNSILVLQKGYTITAMRLTSESGYFSSVEVNVQPDLIDKYVIENGTYDAEDDNVDGYSSVEVYVPLGPNDYRLKSVSNLPQPIASFNDGEEMVMPTLKVAIEPVQDLHGYDSPWVGGAGKNKLENKLTTRTYNGVTATVKDDGTVTLTGTATIATNFFLNIELNLTGNYTISGCPSGGSEDSYYMNALIGSWGAKGKDTGNGIYSDGGTITAVAITVANGYSFPSGGITFKPMIESGNTKTSYAPYSNICPISGWDEVDVNVSGVNQWDEEWESGTYSESTGEKVAQSGRFRTKNFIAVRPSTNYMMVKPVGVAGRVYYYDQNKNFITSPDIIYTQSGTSAINVPSVVYYITFNMVASTYNNDISINYPSTDTSYHAYNGHTYTIDLGGTRYGGEVDVVNGIMTVDRVEVDMGSLSWANRNNNIFSTKLNDAPQGNSFSVICERYKTNNVDAGTLTTLDYTLSTYPSYDYKTVMIRDSNYSTDTDFKNSLDGVKMVYELATPLTIQLTPTQVKSLLGQNNIWADTGDVLEGEYFSRSESVKLPLPSEFVDDQATHITIPNFSSYDKLKIDYKNINTQLQTVTISISSLPENNNPDWGQGGDIYIFNGWYYLVMSRDSTGVWLKECGNPLQQLTAIRI